MSASRERRERARMVSEQPVKKETKKKKKLSEGWILAISVILVVAVVFGTVLGIRYYQQNQTVLTVGGKDVSVKEFNYFYNAAVNSFSSNANVSYVGIDSATPLDEQKIESDAVAMMSLIGLDASPLDAYKKADGSYDATWAEYFAEIAKGNAVEAYTLYQAATEAGFTVTEEVQQSIDSALMNAQLYASIYGMDTDEFIENNYGRGCNEENYREYLKVVNVGYAYADQLTYTDAEITARYEKSPEDYDVVSYLLYTVRATDFMTQEEIDASKEAENKTPNTEAMAQAKAAAEAMEKDFDAASEKVTAYADVTKKNLNVSIEGAEQWLFETAKPGDTKLFEDAENEIYYVVKLLENGNYATVNALMIYIANDAEGAGEVSHEGHDHAADEIPASELSAADALKAVQDGLTADASEENFRNLAADHNDSGTLEITDTYYSILLNNVSKDALVWVADGQQKGAYATFTTTEGTFVLYSMGEGKAFRTLSVTGTLTSEWVDKITDEALAVCNYDRDAAMNGGVGLVLGTQNG